MRTRTLAAAASLACGAAVGFASPAAAQPVQNGLVNVNVSDLEVQVPIAIAANICDVNVAVLVQDLLDDAADCRATGTSNAITTQEDDGAPVQEGLVNLNLSDISVQIPVTVAANVCDVNVAVLVSNIADEADTCTADADGVAITPA
jgi:hypothetical protein